MAYSQPAGGGGQYHNGIPPNRGPQRAHEEQYQQQLQHHNNNNHRSHDRYSHRPFSLNEALPYTPFTSVFPFESGKSYLPAPARLLLAVFLEFARLVCAFPSYDAVRDYYLLDNCLK